MPNISPVSNVQDWVNENFARLAEIISDFDPYLELVFIPPHERKNPEDHARAYAIVDNNPRFKRHIVMYAPHDADPQTILASLFASNTDKNDVLAYIDAEEAARQAFEMKQQIDEEEARKDMVKWWLDTPLHTARLGKGVKIDTRDGYRLEG